MTDHLLHIDFAKGRSLQVQLREHLVTMILGQHFSDQALPSCRKLSDMLQVSRNTVVLVYEKLVDEGYLVSRERSGYFVSPHYVEQDSHLYSTKCSLYPAAENVRHSLNWSSRLQSDLSHYRNIQKPENWQGFPYPFVFGQTDHSLFPISQWRECSRLAQSQHEINTWMPDLIDSDDEFLVEQLRKRVLIKRGINVRNDEILITVGTQNSLYLLASLLAGKNTRLGMEEPGYPDVRNIFTHHGADVVPLHLDGDGVTLSDTMGSCDYVYVTPSHQVPTNATMPMARRKALLKRANEQDFVIIEDDYDSEVNLQERPHPALKSLDAHGRVIYVGSLSKSLSHGLRLGYLVADAEVITQARMLRRMMYRHPPANNQRTAALFISMGYFDSYLQRLRKSYFEKWQIMKASLNCYLPDMLVNPEAGGSSFWLRLPDTVNLSELVSRSMDDGVIIEPGDVHFMDEKSTRPFIRLGFSAIEKEQIEPGIRKLAFHVEHSARSGIAVAV
ncbi:PLP-dependent aminotransferase family protein [uncultured Endozoicomonas sp.]|uniref:MocR-like pyridoxine biosynthesis transcription factor PdxR n=1 Tax=uncultured Endozoicomonas sp. TaxID=432652 RepID=UPI0026089263|nr:PLP-dependent aminotransferase family protein [uncultured Endozoicomonas sp.]